MIKQINFLKADLDTVSTAAMLIDCLDNLQIKRLENKASDSDLKDSSILCIARLTIMIITKMMICHASLYKHLI